jgi:RNA-directed DNA polymerase
VEKTTKHLVRGVKVERVEEAGGSESSTVMVGIGRMPNLKGCPLPAGQVGEEDDKGSGMAGMRGSKRQTGGHETLKGTDWSRIDWRKTQKRVKNLRRRIYRATKQQQWHKAKYLTKLMLRSYSNLLMSIRRVTQVNEGRDTPGVDGQVVKTSIQRGKLAEELRNHKGWRAQPVKRVYIPKPGKEGERPLGIPTIKDRVLQAVVSNAYEPRFEASFEAQSYGFRPGRSCQDAIDEIYIALSENPCGGKQYVIEADIKGAFDNIGHQFILDTIGQVAGRSLIRQWLRARYLQGGELHRVTAGTPQGGVISPLLANIALDGLKRHLGKDYRYARYADDFVIMTKTKEEAERALPKIKQWLKVRGLELKERITHKSEGFDFLGFNIRDYGGKLLIKPQKEKVKGLLKRCKKWLNKNKTVKPETIIQHLNPILRGWANYYRWVVSKKTFAYIDKRLWDMYFRWAMRRHPNRGKRWVIKRYFTQDWKPCVMEKDRTNKKTRYKLFRMSSVPIRRHIKIKGDASPDDPDLTDYWNKHRTRNGKDHLPKGSKLNWITEKQDWCCPICGEHLWNDEPLEIHHLIPVREGGSNRMRNLVWLHEACHHNAGRRMRVGQLA